jgi:hypothetical protein
VSKTFAALNSQQATLNRPFRHARQRAPQAQTAIFIHGAEERSDLQHAHRPDDDEVFPHGY